MLKMLFVLAAAAGPAAAREEGWEIPRDPAAIAAEAMQTAAAPGRDERPAPGAAPSPVRAGAARAAASVVAAPARREPDRARRPLPYREEEVSFASAPGVRIAGTLTLPVGQGPFPAAVLITGSGQQDRDETVLGHRPFLVLADHLARRGVAVLRMDDRGAGGSTGSFAAATLADFADDAEAGLRFLAARPDMARGRVGLVGHSEGGMIAPLVAGRSADVAFVVMLAAPGVPGDSLLRLQGAAILRAEGAGPEAVRALAEVQARVFADVRAGGDSAAVARRVSASLAPLLHPGAGAAGTVSPDSLPPEVRPLLSRWFRSFVAHDPRPALRRLRVPTLALNGTLDVQVLPRENLAAIRAALRQAGNADFRVAEMAGLNHFFQVARTGAPSEYGRAGEMMAPAVLEEVAGWIVRRFGAP